MVFFGKAHWEDAAGEHEALHPHESPPVMWVPLAVLAGLAFAGGALNLPFDDELKLLEKWLEPVIEPGEAVIDGTTAYDWQYLLMAVAATVTIIGVVAAWTVYARRKVKPVEPKVLAHAWYYDEAVSAFLGGPGREGFEAVLWADTHVIDATVDGVGRVATGSGGLLSRLQTGMVRTYAAVVGLGVVALLAWFLLRGVL
jgi:NADH-quinone oxidoreductase subunit L